MQIALHLVLVSQKKSGVRPARLKCVCAVWRGSLVGSRLKERGVMMAIAPLYQGFPFVVEPVSPERVQRWSSYAGQMLKQPGFDLVSAVFVAFWWEVSTYQSYQSAVGFLGSTLQVPSLVFYLDMIVSETRVIAEYWARVGRLMNEHQDLLLEAGYEDAMQHVQMAMDLRLQVAMQVVTWCDQYQLPLPEHTQAFFTEVQAKGM
jgi:hypothetical protein